MMNRKLLLFAASLLMTAGIAKAQFSPFNKSWNVVLDTTVTYKYASTQAATSYLESKPGVSATQFFPYPVAYTARALFAATATTDGEFSLSNRKLTMKNPKNSLIKSSFYNIQNAKAVAKFAFDLDLTAYSGAAAFNIYFGNDDVASRLISASSGFANASSDIFGSFRIVTSGGNVITQYRDAAGTASVSLSAANSLIKVGVSQRVEIFVNSSSSATTYNYGSNPVNLAANTYHVYVDGVKYAVDFPKNGSTYAQSAIDGLSFEFNNNATQELITISNIAITYPTDTDPTLPVSFLSFTGKKSANGVALNWATASEQNNDYFEVSRSTDGNNFTFVGKVSGKGNASEVSNYSLIDRTPSSGINFYRLKQVDKDGTSSLYKEVIPVDFGLGNDDLTAFAANGKLNIGASVSAATLAELEVYDLKGTKLLTDKLQLKAGKNQFSVAADQLQTGVFILRLKGNSFNKTVKIVK
jgi:hypothetical protein